MTYSVGFVVVVVLLVYVILLFRSTERAEIDEESEQKRDGAPSPPRGETGILRFPGVRPEKGFRRLASKVPVKGISLHQIELRELAVHPSPRLLLESTRDADEGAYRVMGYGEESDGVHSLLPLGYLPEEVAAECGEFTQVEAILRSIRLPGSGRGGSVRLDLWVE